MTRWFFVGMSMLGFAAIAWSLFGLSSQRRHMAQAGVGNADMVLGGGGGDGEFDGEFGAQDPFLTAIADDLANLNVSPREPGTTPKDPPAAKILFDTSLDEIVLADTACQDDASGQRGNWAKPGAPVQMLDFDTCEDGLVLVWDDTKGPKPTVSLQRDDTDASKVNVLLDTHTVAQVASAVGITADAVALVPLSSADGARWAAA